MKHFHAYSRAALAAAFLGGACAASAADGPTADARCPLRVVATIFPAYDWVREVVGTNAADVQLTLLLDDGVDLHSYQPTAADLKKVAESDFFIHVGGESDGWVEPALAAAPNPRRKVLNLVKALGDAAKPEEIVEGMEHHHDHGDDHGDKDHDHDAKADKDHDHDHGDKDHDHDHGAKSDWNETQGCHCLRRRGGTCRVGNVGRNVHSRLPAAGGAAFEQEWHRH